MAKCNNLRSWALKGQRALESGGKLQNKCSTRDNAAIWDVGPCAQWRRKRGEGRHAPRAALQGAAFGRAKKGILKFGRFWRIAVCITDSGILHPLTLPVLGPHPNCQCSTTPHKAVRTPGNLHCWPDWSFTCCKTVEDPYCPVTGLLSIAIQCLHYSRVSKFCAKFGNSAWNLVIRFSEIWSLDSL